MRITDFAVRRPVTVVMVICIVLLLGGISLSRLAIDLYPDIKLPVAAVVTNYSGASPEEIEKLVTRPLEEILGTVNNVDQIVSESYAGTSLVVVWFDWGTDMDFATLQMREKIDFIKPFLPEDVESPKVLKMDPNMMPVVEAAVSGGRSQVELKRLVEDVIQNRLERLEGVATVYVSGGLTREIQVLVDPVKLQSYGLSLEQIKQTLRGENLNLSSGEIVEGKTELFVRTLGEFRNVEEIEKVLLPLPGGGSVYLKDVADVIDGYKEVDQITRVNGQPSIGVHVIKQSKTNTVQVAQRVKKELEKLKREMPDDIQIDIVSDQSRFIEQAIGRVAQNTIVGGIFAVLILFLFLRNLRSTLVIGIAIPISIISTFILIYFNNLTLNMMSLGGLALGVGMMVDSSIVILENIFRWRQEGHGREQAAVEGSNEVASAVVASTLTTIAVFLPIVFVEGIAAQLFRQLAMTVSFSLAASLLVSLTLVPMLSSRLLLVNDMHDSKRLGLRRAVDLVGNLLEALTERYRKTLQWSLRHRKAVVVLVAAALAGSFLLVPVVGMEFLPRMDTGEIAIDIELAKGSLLSETDEIATRVENIVKEIPEVKKVFTSVGSPADQMIGLGSAQAELARMRVMLVDKNQRSRSTEDVVEEIRRKVRDIPGADIDVRESDPRQAGGPTVAPISISIKGDELPVLMDLAAQVKEVVEQVPGTREVVSSITEGRPEMQLRIDRDRAARYGLNAAQIAAAVKTALKGDVVTRFRTGDDEIDVRVQLPAWARENLQDLKDLTVVSPLGFHVPLSEVVTFEKAAGPGKIDREDQVRVAKVESQISGRDLGSVVKDIQAELRDFPLPPGYTIEYGGENEEMRESFGSLLLALVLAIVLVYMVMASQFESLTHPFIIMFSMPTTFVGVVLGLALTGRNFSVPTFIGVIMLAGIVVNNAIVLVDYINTLRRRGLSRNEAILKAGPVRLRPILMTTLTTVLALLPTAAGIGTGSEAAAPMATAVVSGLTVSTVFTLVVVPVVYTLVDDLGAWLKRKIRRKTGSGSIALKP
ncbi:efflux RND transporter permease subunit [Calderihabitans maritimus]|uniref:Acriflavin resistance protein n=1 Tax=Calderihabitans maritimus TaxID=1246530 RepID=A0A1Z5HSD0_9FIRM|nr:efflux RND transporter permease subunit [Calderihabitans maritimus]GAW92432.1 acriflavin resistance protein [Calderihabitans maritimus]